MTSRERQLAAIRHELPDRIPMDVVHIDDTRPLAEYLGVSSDNGTVWRSLGIDGRAVSAETYEKEMPRLADGTLLTEWGTLSTGDYGTCHWYPLADCLNVADIDNYAWPDPTAYDFTEAGGIATSLADCYAVRGPGWKPLFCRACDLLGMEEAMLKLVARPALLDSVLEHVFQYTMIFCERLLDACGESMPILHLADDFASQRGMIISPAQWRAFLKPRYARLFEMGKEKGKFIWFHSCGDITEVLPDLIDIGMDVWETVQLHTLPVRPEQLKLEYGRYITFFGGINTQTLPFATPDQVETEVRRCIELLGKNGGYICGPDHHIRVDVPPENSVALFRSAVEFRRSGYTCSEQ